ncbi:MAG: hypothetical protein ACYCYH_03505 [Steroidobacteraceae bacterium]
MYIMRIMQTSSTPAALRADQIRDVAMAAAEPMRDSLKENRSQLFWGYSIVQFRAFRYYSHQLGSLLAGFFVPFVRQRPTGRCGLPLLANITQHQFRHEP